MSEENCFLNLPSIRPCFWQKDKEGAFVFVSRREVQYIQQSSLFYTAGVSVEVQRRQSPAGIQHLAPFSSQLSVFVLHWLHCQIRPVLNAKAPPRKTGPVFLNSSALSQRYLSEDVLSPHIISSGITALSVGESSLSFHLFRLLQFTCFPRWGLPAAHSSKRQRRIRRSFRDLLMIVE